MTIHILDWLIYIILVLIMWNVLLPEELTEEMGKIGGIVITLLLTILYCTVFYYYDWIDILRGIIIPLPKIGL